MLSTAAPLNIKPARYQIIVDVQPYYAPAGDRQLLAEILNELPPLIDMKILAGPYMVDGVEANPGMTGFVIIDYSHISIHTFSDFNQMMVDIFSCKKYSQELVAGFLKEKLGVGESEIVTKVVSWG